jgi:hypothetical protein
MPRWLIPLIVGLGLFGLLVYQLMGEGAVECKVCVSFKGQRHCATAVGPTEDEASEEAHRSACSRMTSGVTEAFACPDKPADVVTCSVR